MRRQKVESLRLRSQDKQLWAVWKSFIDRWYAVSSPDVNGVNSPEAKPIPLPNRKVRNPTNPPPQTFTNSALEVPCLLATRPAKSLTHFCLPADTPRYPHPTHTCYTSPAINIIRTHPPSPAPSTVLSITNPSLVNAILHFPPPSKCIQTIRRTTRFTTESHRMCISTARHKWKTLDGITRVSIGPRRWRTRSLRSIVVGGPQSPRSIVVGGLQLLRCIVVGGLQSICSIVVGGL
ncbi:hypothetical protein PGTUg99_006224 [Puccinia graminis f. sp. tritici]|uniref:Uncharacterized protein n=1 Tax=Puccinia graminis f. sp. tritici TaxID=56615 RepID=A0A5B0M575_PUCGR|nr:hypothetical protein PGTUg99_006224 [Puccinia graminis f. sp. tritici]